MKNIKTVLTLTIGLFILLCIESHAQTSGVPTGFVRLKNHWKTTQYIHVQKGIPEAGIIESGWWSAQWTLEQVAGTDFYRLKNRWKNQYLHLQNASLELGDAPIGWWSAHWTLEKVPGTQYVRFRNRWKNQYLHLQNANLEAGDAPSGWWSAMWEFEGVTTTTPTQPIPDADMCWAASYGRGAGTFPNECAPNEEYDAGGLCYPKCKAGYEGIGPICYKSCPPGFRNDGLFCAKPAPYGRGAGYAWQFGDGFDLSGAQARCERDNPQGCEQSGLIIYPKCQGGFHPVGCCICSPDCPAGYTDIGVSCAKPSYGRGVGTVPQSCSGGKKNQAGLCYVACETGFHGIGPVCWADECPGVFPIRCAAGCARSSNDCFSAVVNQVYKTHGF